MHISINNKIYKAHRLAWILYYNEQPPSQIDHIDRNSLNNAILNLKSSSYKDNCKNKTKQSNNTSSHTGIYFRKDTNKWTSYGWLEGKRYILGCYFTIEEAIEVRQKWLKDNNFSETHGQ